MSRLVRHGAAKSGTPGCALSSCPGSWLRKLAVALLLAAWLGGARAASSDVLPDEDLGQAPALSEPALKKADAMAHYVTGLFEEESDGPEKALESKKRALELDPGFSDLAIEVSYEYLRRGDTGAATSVLKDAIRANPKSVPAYLALATIYQRHLGKPELALKYTQEALETAPELFAPYAALWEIHTSQKETAKAEQVLQKAGRGKSTDPTYWLALADLRVRALPRDGSAPAETVLAEITRALDEAAKTSGGKAETLARIGDLFVLSRQLDRAVPHYRDAVRRRPSLFPVKEKLAECLIETGDTAGAIPLIEDLVAANPLNLSAYDRLTALYLRERNFSKALRNARQALIMEPGKIERHTLVVDLLFRLKEFDQMSKALEDARQGFPNVPRLAYMHGVALSSAKRHDAAMRAFDEAVAKATNVQPEMLNADFYFDYGAAAEQGGNAAKAAELFRKSIALDPANAGRSYNYMGYMWVDRNVNLEEAEQLIRRALAVEPGNGAYIDSLGWLYYRQGKYQEALTELLRAAEAVPEPDGVVMSHIGDAYEKLDRKSEALLYWQKSLQADPENKDVAAKVDKAREQVVQKP